MLVFNETDISEKREMRQRDDRNSANDLAREERKRRAAWLHKLDTAIGMSMNEELPDFQRRQTMRDPIDLRD